MNTRIVSHLVRLAFVALCVFLTADAQAVTWNFSATATGTLETVNGFTFSSGDTLAGTLTYDDEPPAYNDLTGSTGFGGFVPNGFAIAFQVSGTNGSPLGSDTQGRLGVRNSSVDNFEIVRENPSGADINLMTFNGLGTGTGANSGFVLGDNDADALATDTLTEVNTNLDLLPLFPDTRTFQLSDNTTSDVQLFTITQFEQQSEQQANGTPEPSALVLAALGLIGFVTARRSRRRCS